VIREPLVRVRSIDVGTHVELREWDQLLNCAVAAGEFSLVQAALAISGFTPRNGESLTDALLAFGGGLEITTLAAIPKGSGLGTSSIMGAVLLAVINRVLGRKLTPTQLFHGVLRLEQKLTTGGGWQDQIGGSVGGLKLISTQPAMVPEATIRYVPADVLDPHENGGQTLLYYTGITRLAKNILQQVVGRYLDRDREAMRVLRGLHEIAPAVAEAMARKDLAEFGRSIDRVWELNKRLDPDSSNERIEVMLACVRPWIHGAKLLGAGGGGFLILVCKSPQDAVRVREELAGAPPNERARFFDFTVSPGGLSVSVC
jgi:fucokinase